ncbi:hypothetical protein [Streptomyces sp. NPDC051310]|uniref:hypothetical protein n=1 Tax=Streptomyces sp. NPDC051310 TaxID=3365649 RepID=UPI0037943F79
MTPSELTALFLGFDLGVLTMGAVMLIDQYADARRITHNADRQLARAEKHLEAAGWRDILARQEQA